VHMYQDAEPENHLERSTPVPSQLATTVNNEAEVQRKRMLIALGILLAALVSVVLKDWDFWFPPDGAVQEAAVRSKNKMKSVAAVPASTPATPARQGKPVKAQTPVPAAPQAPFSAIAERAALPPLQVEVVAGNRHVGVPAKSNAIHVDVDSGATSSATTSTTGVAASAPANSGERVQLSPQATQSVTVSVPPDYPLLARQMRVQGAVRLQALISREGTIQELQILSGPGILAAAAREAVKQWHFKPYIQNGQPVETQARITVNFTISTN
jgi:periplasmic protein TonB